VKQLAAKYKAKYGNEPNGYEAYGYDVGNIVASAIQKAGSTDKQKILDVLHKQGIPGGLIPEYKFDENGDVINGPLYIYTIANGVFKFIERFTPETPLPGGVLTTAPGLSTRDQLVRAERLAGEARALLQDGRYADAVPRAQEALSLREKALGPRHGEVADSLD